MLCIFRGDAPAKRLSLYAGFSHRAANTRLRQATKAAHRTDSDVPATAVLTQRISAWREPHFAVASSARLWSFARSRQGRRAAGELVPLGPCFPGLQVHARASPSYADLNRHSHHPAAACVAQHGTLGLLPSPGVGKALTFAPELRQTRCLSQCLHHRRGEATGSLHTAHSLGWGTVEECLHSFSGTPFATHNAATSWWKTASDSPFLHGVVSASSGNGTWWQAQVCPWDR